MSPRKTNPCRRGRGGPTEYDTELEADRVPKTRTMGWVLIRTATS